MPSAAASTRPHGVALLARWLAGRQDRRLAAFACSGRGRSGSRLSLEISVERLKPGGRLYVMVSSDSDLDLFGRLINRAGFFARLVHERSILIESFIIYELRAPALCSARRAPRGERAPSKCA